MNTSALKSFAPAMRRQLMEAVTRKLDFVLTAQTPDYLDTFAPQVAALRQLNDDDRTGLIERVAYTWFNRLAALRYLDARGWHPFRARVLTAATPDETQPELLKLTRSGALPDELKAHTDAARLDDLLDGRIPSNDAQGEVYRHLVLAACRFYHQLLPDLFEKLDDETELLLPDDLLTSHSVAQGFRTSISDADCEEVEVIGWLYQFYISEKKDAVMARKKAVPTEDIPAVTQLFTPHWIVRYLVENSLGRLWLLNRPNSRLREKMPYYIESAEESSFLRIERPEEIRLLDPAVGSGHMLTYAFDLLVAIYEEEGYAPSEIPGLILRHNLFGLEIDPRAAGLAELALVFKAREKARGFFRGDNLVSPHIVTLQDVHFADGELAEFARAQQLGHVLNERVLALLQQFENATTFGSLIVPACGEAEIQSARRAVTDSDVSGNLFAQQTQAQVLRVLEMAEMLTQRYHVVVANPPYLGGKGMNAELKRYASTCYAKSKADLFAMFIERGFTLVQPRGLNAMITMQSWMFLSSYQAMREDLLLKRSILSMAHLGPRAFDSFGGEVVQATAFVAANATPQGAKGIYLRLVDGRSENEKAAAFREAIANSDCGWLFHVNAEEFKKIPGSPIAYWFSEKLFAGFDNGKSLDDVLTFKQGVATSDNERFLRYWHEVSQDKVDYSCDGPVPLSNSKRKWFPYNKGGAFRKWFGNNEYLVNWERDGDEMKEFTSALPQGTWVRLKSRDYYCLPCITYSALSSGEFGGRISDAGFLFDTKGSCIFGSTDQLRLYTGLLNSRPSKKYLDVLCPTLDYSMVGIKQIPLPSKTIEQVADIVISCCHISRADWDAFETSWDFTRSPMLPSPDSGAASVAECFAAWASTCSARHARLKELEEANNRLFIDAYGLQDELSPEVPDDQITLARADARRDMAALLSYAVGCMMGRYSLDQPGLVLADAGDTLQTFLAKIGKPLEELAFAPDSDGIVPLLDAEWSSDDIVARTRDFLRAAFGPNTLTENVRFIEESLGKELRKYFLSDFYKDHLQTYKKRPIYWLVQSPKKGFSCLIYLHRYTRDTMNVVLNRYLREYQNKLRHHLAHLAQVQAAATEAREKTVATKELDRLTKVLHECEEWERETLLPLAQARIELDLDDGVKVNYLKLASALAPIAGLEKKEA